MGTAKANDRNSPAGSAERSIRHLAGRGGRSAHSQNCGNDGGPYGSFQELTAVHSKLLRGELLRGLVRTDASGFARMQNDSETSSVPEKPLRSEVIVAISR